MIQPTQHQKTSYRFKKRSKSRRMVQLDHLEDELNLWKHKLETNPEEAEKLMLSTLRGIQGNFHHTEIAKFYSQMSNGCATPQDFNTKRVAS